MKRRNRITPPPSVGGYVQIPVSEASADRSELPIIPFIPAGPPVTVSVGIGEQEDDGRPLAPLIEYAHPRPDFDALAKLIEEGKWPEPDAAPDGGRP